MRNLTHPTVPNASVAQVQIEAHSLVLEQSNKDSIDQSTPAASLLHVLNKSEEIKGIVEECAADLSSVNSTLNDQLNNDQLNNNAAHPGVLGAIEASEGIESRIQEAAEDLATVNLALGAEVKVRHDLEDQLTATKAQATAAEHAALHDPLTSLPNRVLFNDRLEHGLAQAKRHGWMLAVMFIDLDDFKKINDSHGHAAGD